MDALHIGVVDVDIVTLAPGTLDQGEGHIALKARLAVSILHRVRAEQIEAAHGVPVFFFRLRLNVIR